MKLQDLIRLAIEATEEALAEAESLAEDTGDYTPCTEVESALNSLEAALRAAPKEPPE